MHSKGGQPGHTCAHGWSSHIYSYLLGHLAMIVVSVLISVTTDMSPTGDLLVTSILAGGSVFTSLLWSLHVLRWHGTEPVAAHPMG